MDKLEWLKWRNSVELPVRLCYEYYNDVASPAFKRYSYDEFENLYAQYLQHCSHFPCPDTRGQPKQFNFEKLVRDIHTHFDTKFKMNE